MVWESAMASMESQTGAKNSSVQFWLPKDSFVKMSCRDSVWVTGENPMD